LQNCSRFEEAAYWIQLRHGGEQDGIGTVSWGSKELERFNARVGRRGPNAKSMDVLDYAHENSLLTDDQIRDFPLTNLTRLLNDPTVRGKMGLELTADGIRSNLQTSPFNKGLSLLLKEIADGDVTVTNIKRKDQRRSYVEDVLSRAGVDVSKRTTSPYEVKGSQHFDSGSKPQPRRQGRRPSHLRKTMVPKSTRLKFTLKRLNDVF